MATTVVMPKLGLTMEEGMIVEWHKQEGDAVEQGELLLEITTEKVNADIEAPASGILRGIRAEAGDTVPVGFPLAFIAALGEELEPASVDRPVTGTEAAPAAHESVEQPDFSRSPVPVPPQTVNSPQVAGITPLAARVAADRGIDPWQLQGTGPEGRVMKRDVLAYLEYQAGRKQAIAGSETRILATPIVKRLAREQGLDLAQIPATGPGGLVIERDLIAYQAGRTTTTQEAAFPGIRVRERLPLAGRRKVIADRMQRSANEAPHIQLSVDIDMTSALERRQGASLTAFVTWITAQTLLDHPLLNASLQGREIVVFEAINIGVATDTEDGLIVPVVHDAHTLSLAETDVAIRELVHRAHQGTLSLDDISNGTFTISNLGMMKVDRFTAIINPPQAAIMALGQARRRPWVKGDSTIAVRPVMNVTISADHRILDGAVVARFLQGLQERLA